jgi:hypothetical protein
MLDPKNFPNEVHILFMHCYGVYRYIVASSKRSMLANIDKYHLNKFQEMRYLVGRVAGFPPAYVEVIRRQLREQAESQAEQLFSFKVGEFIKYTGELPPGVIEVEGECGYEDKSYKPPAHITLPTEDWESDVPPVYEGSIQRTLYIHDRTKSQIHVMPPSEEFWYRPAVTLILDGDELELPKEIADMRAAADAELENARQKRTEQVEAERLDYRKKCVAEVLEILGITDYAID